MTHPAPDGPPPAGGDAAEAPSNALTRVTVNLTPRATTALNILTAASADNRTDAINAALRITAVLLRLAHPDGTVHVVAPDGAIHVVHLP
ncbi:hypothetical protein ACNTMW_18255 [Planosporangium sp. 12N6]|uniref:hypothetical protein n=1 Tax=Planosporangium spinosum TaxID=3402278 RepID=UPI003CF654F7